MILRIFLSGLMISLFLNGWAQEEGDDRPVVETAPRASATPGLFGKAVDSKTNRGIEAAAVQVFFLKTKVPAGEPADSLIAGMLTQSNGDFKFTGLALPDSFAVRVSALGYSENSKIVTIPPDQREAMRRGMDLGNIKLGSESDLLGTVTVVGQRPALQMGIDRKVFNVDKSITSTGGTAVDVMRNVPSINVDVDGNVTMRNTSPQIFVDGRPTILTLEQIAADDIERIELITNPSAKFDAASSGGIVNVVLKKNRRMGFNGLASVGVGTPGVLNGNLSLNLRQGKVNFFASGSYGKSGGIAKSESERHNKSDGLITDYFKQVSNTERDRVYSSVRFGLDYFIDNRNILSLSQGFSPGSRGGDELQSQEYLNHAKELFQTGERVSQNSSRYNRNYSRINYTHNFPKQGMELTADATYNYGSGTGESMISNYYSSLGGNPSRDPNFVRNNSTGKDNQFTIQTDFVNPLSEDSKLEMGLRAFRQENANVYSVFSVDQNGASPVKLPLSTNIAYDETIYAGYTTYTNKWKSIRYQVGLRAEYAQFRGELVDSAQHFGYKLPSEASKVFDGLFPSLYLTKEVGEGKEVQANFSRRIRRPRFWQLNPYVDINDPLNIRQGNPEIRPEYVNAFELNYNQQFDRGNFLTSLYFHNNTGDITSYSDTISTALYEKLNNAAIDPNAILNTFINAQYTNRMGAEFILNYRMGDFEVIPNLNLQYRKVKAVVGELNLNNEGFNWETKVMFNYRLRTSSAFFNNTSFQLSANYESQEVIPQGRNKAQFDSDFALRKEFMKNNAAAITFGVNDIFNTDRWGQIYDTDTFYQDSYRRWRVRSFRLTFSYRFGKRDVNVFGQRQRGGMGGEDGGGRGEF